LLKPVKDRSSSRGRERTRLKTLVHGRRTLYTRRDLRVSENMWNGAREISGSLRLCTMLAYTRKLATREKV
jgi:hypothetical protein